MEVKLSYGIREGKLVHISELDLEHNGNACGCICPECGKPLCARANGKKQQKHFAHQVEEGCSSTTAQETALHLLAKEIIKENKELRMPGWKISPYQFAEPWMEFELRQEAYKKYRGPKEISDDVHPYEFVALEKRYGDIVADAVISAGKKECLIEIHVFHPVDEEKVEKVKKLGLPMLEIHLNNMDKRASDREAVKQAVLYGMQNRKWINNPKMDEAIPKAKEAFLHTYKQVQDEA